MSGEIRAGGEKKELGRFGEDAAAEYLRKKHYKILCRNFSNKYGEVDIIARKKSDIIFVEVKTRFDDNFGTPAEAVTYYKRRRLIMCAKFYMAQNELNCGARFDVIEVYAYKNGASLGLREINHIEGAFESNEIYM